MTVGIAKVVINTVEWKGPNFIKILSQQYKDLYGSNIKDLTLQWERLDFIKIFSQ